MLLVELRESSRVDFLTDNFSFISVIIKSELDNFSSISFLPEGVLFVNLCGNPCPKIITEFISEDVT